MVLEHWPRWHCLPAIPAVGRLKSRAKPSRARFDADLFLTLKQLSQRRDHLLQVANDDVRAV